MILVNIFCKGSCSGWHAGVLSEGADKSIFFEFNCKGNEENLKKVWVHPTSNGYEGQDYQGRRITMIFQSLWEVDEGLIWVATERF